MAEHDVLCARVSIHNIDIADLRTLVAQQAEELASLRAAHLDLLRDFRRLHALYFELESPSMLYAQSQQTGFHRTTE
ncbi:Aste57867_24314 [Aphanomyces stellatus]|uniref:Aste57867_24314 protein n=1 Tax=Aphanomyces stellatus TaxID=120398 RepID=A0A485LQB7_9STRA|nr:hypothetical protein As57867_024239 [Aphanomyces stellatus]VFU00954.1 Aste57867_24314 [Aphanomyces stellatus]